MAERSWCLVVPHHARGAQLARHRIAGELAGVVPSTLLADVIGVVAELVGNAVRHADPLPGGVIRVAWQVHTYAGGLAVQVRVTDGGAAQTPQIRVVEVEATDGRGLKIVAALAERWGVDRDGLGQSVWAELAHGVAGASRLTDSEAKLSTSPAPARVTETAAVVDQELISAG